MTVREHVYDVPSDEELAQLVGAATPHFALQIRDRVASLMQRLPVGDARRATLQAHIARLEHLASDGEDGGQTRPNLPARPSLIP